MIDCILNAKVGDSIEFSSKDNFVDLVRGKVLTLHKVLKYGEYPTANYPIVGSHNILRVGGISSLYLNDLDFNARNMFRYFYLIYPGNIKVHRIFKAKK